MKLLEFISTNVHYNILLQNPGNVSSSSSKKSKEIKLNKIPVKEIFERKDVASSRPLSKENDSISGSHNWRSEVKVQGNRSSSIISGSQKLKDLQELHKELNKSSYDPPRPWSMVILN